MSSNLNEKDKALKLYSEGLEYFHLRKLGPAIKTFEQSINLKEDTNYASYYELAKIYVSLGDYQNAHDCCVKSIALAPGKLEPVYFLAHILKRLNIPMSELIKIMEAASQGLPYSSLVLPHIYYIEGFYQTALIYITDYSSDKPLPEDLKLLKVKCLLRCSRYNECISYIDTFSKNNLSFFKARLYKILCGIILCQKEKVWSVLSEFNINSLSIYNRKVLSVYTQLFNLTSQQPASILSEDPNDQAYTETIFEIYEILLVNKEFDLFEKSLELLNLVSDKTVLLQLGKLYYKYGYTRLAKKELLRSIKLFEIWDVEALNILEHINTADQS